MADKPTLRPNEQPLPGYHVQWLIGKGGLGEVYFGTSRAGKEVALKLFIDKGRGIQSRGARTCLNLNHPNLVHLYDLATDDHGREWLVMEFVPGESLDKRIGPNRLLPLDDARAFFADMAAAVHYLHDHNIIHRDLKPANLLLPRGTGRLKVVDFDLCRTVDPTLTGRIGTDMYMAPEVHTGKYDHRADVYSAGLILAEMLTGRPVFDDPEKSVVMQHQLDTPDLSKVPGDRLRNAIARSLAKNSAERFFSLAEMAAEVERGFAELIDIPRMVPVAVPIAAAQYPALPETVPVAVPVVPPRTRTVAAGLVSGLLAVPVLAALFATPFWLALSGTDWPLLIRLIVLTSAVGWAALLAGVGLKAGERARFDRRTVLVVCGFAIGALAYWMDGWPTPQLFGSVPPGPFESYLYGAVMLPSGTLGVELCYLLYFALALCGPRWWRATAEGRESRLSPLPLIEAAAWGAVLLFAWPWASGNPLTGLAPLVLAALVIQIVSPWVRTVSARPARKKRLRTA